LRRLIINADDFGLTSGVNQGILESHEKGVVTSATLMACGRRFDEAVTLAKGAPSLSVGCHVVLVDGSPMLDATKIPSLIPSPTAASFRHSLLSFAYLGATARLDRGEIAAEITAQIQRLRDAGIEVTHLDSHKHTHMFPAVLRGMLAAAKNCGVRAIRNPFEPFVFATVRHLKRHFQLRMMRRFRRSFRSALEEAGVRSPDGCIGIAATGGLNLRTFQGLIESLPEGTWEFVSHPGYNDAELSGVNTRLRDSRERELQLLTLEAVKELFKREQIQLISYRALVQDSG